jgi:hypothetical protein
MTLNFCGSDRQALHLFLDISLRTVCGLREEELIVEDVQILQDSGTSVVQFRVVGMNQSAVMLSIGKLERCISDPDSHLNRLPRMSSVFRNCTLEVGDYESGHPSDVITTRKPVTVPLRSELPPNADKDPFAVVLVGKETIGKPSDRYVTVEVSQDFNGQKRHIELPPIFNTSSEIAAIDAALSRPPPAIPESLSSLMHEVSIH